MHHFVDLAGLLAHLPHRQGGGLIRGIAVEHHSEIEDDEIDGSTFATVGSLSRFVESKLG